MKGLCRKSRFWKFFLVSAIIGTGLHGYNGNNLILTEAFGAMYWNAGNGDWSDSRNWLGDPGAIYIGGGNSTEATVTSEDSLVLENDIYIGYDGKTYNNSTSYPAPDPLITTNTGRGTLVVNKNFTTTQSVYLGMQFNNKESSGEGTLTVNGNLQIDGSLHMGRDGMATLEVGEALEVGEGRSVKIGSGEISTIQIGEQAYLNTTGAYLDIENPIRVDFSKATDVGINVKGFYIAAYPGTYKSLSGSPPTQSNQRFQYSADVDFGTNTEIQAEEMVIASSYGGNLLPKVTTVEFGAGDTKLSINDFYIGYWKSENPSIDPTIDPDSDFNLVHNTVSIRKQDNSTDATATFTLQGVGYEENGKPKKANLYIGYQDCDTSNTATGTLDLSNTRKATLNLDELYIGYKSEQSGIQNRSGASEGLLILGDHATLTANLIQIGYKEANNLGGSQTIGKLTMGGDSFVSTETLSLGNSDDKSYISYSHLDLSGNSTFNVTNGASFHDNISIKMANNARMNIEGVNIEGGTILEMYANWNMNLSGNSLFQLGAQPQGRDLNLEGISRITITDYAQFVSNQNFTLTYDSEITVSGTGQYVVDGNVRLHAGDVRHSGTDIDGTPLASYTDSGEVRFTVANYGEVSISGNLEAWGNTTINMRSQDDPIGNPFMHVQGDATFDSTQHSFREMVYKDGASPGPAEGQGNISNKAIDFNIFNGTCQIDGNTNVTGMLDIRVQGGTLKMKDLIVHNPKNTTGIVTALVTDGLLEVENSYRSIQGTGSIEFHLIMAGGEKLDDGTVLGGKVRAKKVGALQTSEEGIAGHDADDVDNNRPLATVQFYGGTFVVEQLGSEHMPYYLDQSVHVYQSPERTIECTYSILSPGDDGTYGTTTIVGKTYSKTGADTDTESYHTYNIVNGTIRLDMSPSARDYLTILGSMNMGGSGGNAIFDIHVTGTTPISGFEEKNGETIAFVTLATATEFYINGEASLFSGDLTGDLPGDLPIEFKWTGDDTPWKYYISSVSSNGENSPYELRAYRTARADEVPEPATVTLLLLGLLTLVGCCRKARRN